jgi:hypothetical protein
VIYALNCTFSSGALTSSKKSLPMRHRPTMAAQGRIGQAGLTRLPGDGGTVPHGAARVSDESMVPDARSIRVCKRQPKPQGRAQPLRNRDLPGRTLGAAHAAYSGCFTSPHLGE